MTSRSSSSSDVSDTLDEEPALRNLYINKIVSTLVVTQKLFFFATNRDFQIAMHFRQIL